MQTENQINSKYNVLKHPLNNTRYFKLDKSQDWVGSLLKEFNEKAEEKTPEEYFENSEIKLDLEISKSFKHPYGEYLLVKGKLESNFFTPCVRTLEEMPDSVSIEFKTCFIESRFQEDEELKDQTEIFIADNMYELYFFEKGFANLTEMVHEQAYLSINQYPIKDAEAPLPWGNESSDTKQ